ncbi:arabinosyltransferase, partial [Mycobacterium avium subsp. paratuberculosis 10-8425]
MGSRPVMRRPGWPVFPYTTMVRSSLWIGVAVVAVLFAWGGWQRRWIADDGLIVLRTVRNLLAGNGPVFNQGERVEANTSTAWTYLMYAGSWVGGPLRMEYVALALALTLSVLGVALLMLGAARLYAPSLRGRRAIMLPAGALVYIALPPSRDFATSGLESGLALAYLGLLWWMMVCWAQPVRNRPDRREFAGALAFVAGFSVLVRPELALMGGLALIMMLVAARTWRRRALIVAAGGALPVAYEIFRMGYYGLLVPGTALAKDAAGDKWSQGMTYLSNFDAPYLVWVPAVLLVLLGVLLAVATPLLPVDQTTAQLNWPQNGSFGSVEAPLIGYVATDLNITVPCQAAAGLAGRGNPGKTVLLSTVPKQAPKAVDRGLLIVRANDDLVLVVRNVPVVTAPLSQVLGPACQRLTFTAHADKVTAEFVGLTQGPNTEHPGVPLRGEKSGYDFRPQIVGVFTDLSGPAPPGLSFSATIDTRYSSSPTPLKMAAMILGLVLTGAALVALHILDTADGTRHRRFLPARWWSIGGLDALVIAVLTWWHFVGANTSDDGYILTMARVSEHAGYMANYYRWFGTPEAPFGWYYDLLALWAHVSTTSIWMRLPTLAMALTCWWVISREVMPRLGHAVKQNRAAAWTAAGMFLAVWLPLDNGLRPEPIIALGILLTWCSVERAVATSRLLPVAVACIIGALTLFSGPTGIASIGALLVAIGPLRTILHRRITRFGALPLIAPLLAAATVTAILIFRDQTLAGEVQASMLKRAVGPSLSWFDEHIRYERLFMASPDGSVARRFAVLALVLALGVTVAMSLRKGRIPGTATGPSRRIVGITIISFVAMMFTPTKWTHHFGVFAGLAGPLGALAAVAVTAAAMRSRRNRTVYAAVVLFLVALSFASVNGWWYVSNFGVPWSNAFPAWHYAFATALLGLTVLVLLLAAWFHFVAPDDGPPKTRWGARLAGIIQSPLAIATWALVVFEVASLTLAMTDQYPAWSVGRSNLQALTGKTCGLAEDVLVEQDPSAGLL